MGEFYNNCFFQKSQFIFAFSKKVGGPYTNFYFHAAGIWLSFLQKPLMRDNG